MFGKVKLRPTDRLYTKYIRLRYNYTCQNPKCRRIYHRDDCHNLGVSHFYGRGRENTRFDDDNCLPFCTLPCHYYLQGEGRKEYDALMLERLGNAGCDLLMLRANTFKRRDDVIDKFIITKKLEGLMIPIGGTK